MTSWTTGRVAAVTLQISFAAFFLVAPANAEETERVYVFNIKAQPLADALIQLSRQSEQQVVSDSAVVGTQQTWGVVGRLTREAALEKLLAATGLTFEVVDEWTVRVYSISVAPATVKSTASQPTTQKRELYGVPQAEVQTRTFSLGAEDSVDTDAKANTAPSGLQVVTVTAQKKSERLQDVPVPVTVLAADQLLMQNDVGLEDYFASVPGLSLAPVGPGMQSLSLRGVTVSVVGNPTVGVMIDDMPYGSSTLLGFGAVVLPDLDPSDLERVEVLRGPQGTLYGASSMGGLIKFVTRDPSSEGFSGQVQALGSSIENGDGDTGYGLRAAVNVPVSENVALRLSGFTRHDPGFIDNVTTGERAINSTDVYGGRISALWQPNDGLSIKLGVLFQQTDGDGSSVVDADPALQPLYGDLEQARQVEEGYSSEVRYFTGTVRATLGDLEFASLTAYGMNDFENISDESPAYGPLSQLFYGVDGANGGNIHDVTKFSQEFRLTSAPGEKYEWLIGAFYTYEDADIYQFDGAVDLETGEQVGILADYYFPTDLTEYALFADLTVHYSDRFSVQFGGRGSHNTQRYDEIDSGPAIPIFYGVPSPVHAEARRTSAEAFTYLLTPQWKLSPDTMLYARFSSGYRLGGNNIQAEIGQIPPNYEPDKTTNYEVGVKGNLLEGRMSYDASLYYTDWRDIQIFQYSPITFSGYNDNAGTARTAGLELSMQAMPTDGLTIAATATWINAELTEDFPDNAIFGAEDGDRMPYSPRFSGSLSLDQDFPLGASSWTGFIGGSLVYQGDRLGEFGSTFGTGERFHYPDYTTIGLHAGARSDSWTVNLFANNITDERALVNVRDNPYLQNLALYQNLPRTIGLNITKSF